MAYASVADSSSCILGDNKRLIAFCAFLSFSLLPPQAGSTGGQLCGPTGVAVSRNGIIFVSDSVLTSSWCSVREHMIQHIHSSPKKLPPFLHHGDAA